MRPRASVPDSAAVRRCTPGKRTRRLHRQILHIRADAKLGYGSGARSLRLEAEGMDIAARTQAQPAIGAAWRERARERPQFPESQVVDIEA
jgi:hypothetical protein